MSFFAKFFNEFFNYSDGKFEEAKNRDGKPFFSATDVNPNYPIKVLDPKFREELGRLRMDFNNKYHRMNMALGAPLLMKTGGGESLQFFGQYGGAAPASDYVAPDRLKEVIYSTARILGNFLHMNEDKLREVLKNPEIVNELQERLRELHNQEKELFSSVYTLGEVANLSSTNVEGLGEINPQTQIKDILDKIRKIHQEAEKNRKAIFVAFGMP
jgi:hypothetical protein